MFHKSLLSIITILALTTDCLGQPVITITKEKESKNIGLQIAIFPDTTGLLTIKEVSSKPFNDQFLPGKQLTPNLGSTLLPVWCRFKIKNLIDQKLALAIDNSQIERVDLYSSITENEFTKSSISVYQPFNQRELLLNKSFFWLDIPKDSTEVFYLRLQTLTGLQFPITVYTIPSLVESEQEKTIIYGLYIGIMIIMILYNLLIYFSIKSVSYLLYVVYVSFMMLTNLIDKGLAFEYLWPSYPGFNHYINVVGCFTGIFAILFSISFLRIYRYTKKIYKLLNGIIICYLITIAVILFKERYIGLIMTEIFSVIASVLLFSAGVVIYRRGYKPALYYLFGWTFLLIGVNILILKDFNIVPYNSFTANGMVIGSAIESLLLSLALGNRINLYKKEKEKAQNKALRSLEEQRKLIHGQKTMLEKKVDERTMALKQTNKELSEALQNLKDTEAQLIQSEKMASLGELTAGIAHEIQNPLNFVNNFSEVNTELIDEMQLELQAGNSDEIVLLANTIKENEQKINFHGRRADAIVKNMLQHSRSSSGVKEPTDINKLADEYLRLAYHGLRAKDKLFNATMKTEFDQSIGKINIVQQDIGRVILNLITNAFYAVSEKKNSMTGQADGKGGVRESVEYEPTVTVVTKNSENKVEINVIDNGNGIPHGILDKIFQPFFTTKPTGKGTGLGLSLSYDIVKTQGGEIKVETREGHGTMFMIILPK